MFLLCIWTNISNKELLLLLLLLLYLQGNVTLGKIVKITF